MTQKILNSLGLLTIIALFNFAQASSDPKPHMEKVTAEMSAEILANKEKIQQDHQFAKGLIEKHLLPEVDTEYMAKRILGKKIWTEASETQQKQFTEQFVGLLMNTYAKGLADYDGQPIVYEDTQYSSSGNTANVRSKFIPNQGEPVIIDYRLKAQTEEKWLITDVIIEGVSMAKSFANQYREQIEKIGLQATIDKLAKENSTAQEVGKISDSEK